MLFRSHDIEIENGALIHIGGVLLLDQGLPEPAANERLGQCHENSQHSDQAKFCRGEKTSQNDGDDELNALLAESLARRPGQGGDYFLFEGHV